jgi:hypothetical protein
MANRKVNQIDKLDAAIEWVNECQTYKKKVALQRNKYEEYYAERERCKQELRQFDDETERMVKELREELAQKRNRVMEQHEHQVANHSKNWQSEAKSRNYSHASPRLLLLRKQYNLLAGQARWREAEGLRVLVEKAEHEEEANAIHQRKMDFSQSREKLEQKHASELQFFDAQVETRVKQFRQKRDNEKLVLLNRFKKVKNTERSIADGERLWVRTQQKEHTSPGHTSRSGTASVTTRSVKPKERSLSGSMPEAAVLPLPPLDTSRRAPRPQF